MFKQPRFVSLIRGHWFFAGLDTRHLNVYCFENSFSSFDENYKSIYRRSDDQLNLLVSFPDC